MLLTRNQFLIILAVLIASCGAWGIILKMFIDSSLALRWSFMWWFFGGCLVAAIVAGVYEYQSVKVSKNRRSCDIKIDGEINPELSTKGEDNGK